MKRYILRFADLTFKPLKIESDDKKEIIDFIKQKEKVPSSIDVYDRKLEKFVYSKLCYEVKTNLL